LGGLGVAYAIIGLMLLVLAIGVTATFVSMHDRLCDLVGIVGERGSFREQA
jgi:hypothetical protein